jgi:predicted nucleic acid-binding protein
VKWLLDTNVLSETRKGPRTHGALARWWRGVEQHDICVSVLTLGEIRRGVERLRKRDAATATAIEAWLLGLQASLGQRLLGVDLRITDAWGRLTAGRTVPDLDSLLAATALVHGLILVTRNTRDVEGLGVLLLNPFADSP